MLIKELLNLYDLELLTIYPDVAEREMIRFLSFESVLGKMNRVDLFLKKNDYLSEIQVDKLTFVLQELKSAKPIQYIIGKTEFYNHVFNVNKNVLIPRPETEELVNWVIQDFASFKHKMNILDMGTGSGCIAVSLKLALPHSKVSALDVSEKAIETAKSNAKTNDADIEFLTADILNIDYNLFNSTYDVIVSNPPYVKVSEKTLMRKNVLDFEPHIALFVADETPLLYYIKIAEFARNRLNNGEKLYFEINESLSNEVLEMLNHRGFVHSQLKNDMHGKPRMIKSEFIK